VLSNQDANAAGWHSRLKVSGDTGNVLMACDGGNVGIGTTTPNHKFHVVALDAVGLFESSGAQAFLRLTTREGLDKRVEITNRPGGRFSVWTSGGFDSFNVTQDGNVGIGTIAPQAKLQVTGGAIMPAVGNSATAGIQFPPDPGGGGFDAAFIRYFVVAGETTKLLIGCQNDADDSIGFFQFGQERLTIHSGNVGIGTTTPSALLDVAGHMNVQSAFSLLGWTSGFSDERLKKDIVPLSGALDKLCQLRGVQFSWREPEKMGNLTSPQIGLVAQEVEKVFPDWVMVGPHGYKALTFRGFEALTIEALRELRGEIDVLRTRLEAAVGQPPATSPRPQRKRGNRETRS
jgi:hypothetical protein